METPLKNKVIILPDTETNETESGIVLTGKQQSRTWTGQVVSSKCEGINYGNRVIYNRQATTELADGLIICDGEVDIFAIID